MLSIVAFICSQARDVGQPCSSTVNKRYFFNVATRNCESFNYDGCGGNRNNFATAIQCSNFCTSAGCPPGTIAHHNSSSNMLTTCQPGLSSILCPTDYICLKSSLFGQGVCCGVPATTGKCPNGQDPYFDALTNAPRQCQAKVAGACPAGYVCNFSPSDQVYYCCGTAASKCWLESELGRPNNRKVHYQLVNFPGRCSQGRSPLFEYGTNNPRQCTPGLTGACPSGFTCQATSVIINGVPSTTGYCCGEESIGLVKVHLHEKQQKNGNLFQFSIC